MAAAAACATIVIVSHMDVGAVELLDRHSGIKPLTTSANADQSRGGQFAKVDDRDFVLLTPSPADLPSTMPLLLYSSRSLSAYLISL